MGRLTPNRSNKRGVSVTLTSARRKLIVTATGAGAVLVVCGAILLAPRDVASSTTAPTTNAERVAKRFVDAYGTYHATRALKYLSKEGIATGSGHTALKWGSPDEFRSEVAMAKARHIEQTPPTCEQQGNSDEGTTVRCAFDYHAFRSDEIGRGPFRDNYWELVVRDGKVTSAVSTWSYITNGFSAQMWEPFQAWVTSAHPEDLQTLYPVGDPPITEQGIRLWERRLREWAATVKESAQ
jgi:hypothetical protein